MSQPKGSGGSNAQFFEIKDEAMIAKILDVAQRHKILVTVWTKNQALKFDTNFAQFFQHLKKIYLQFPVTVTENQFNDALKAQKSDEILGSFQIDQVTFFFRTQYILKTDKNLLQILVPPSIFKLQRRQNLRIPFSRKMAPKLTMFDPSKPYDPDVPIRDSDILAFRVIDVSAGGVAIAASVDMKDKFPKNAMIHEVRFKVRATEIPCNAIVTHVSEILNESRKPILKVGLKFTTLKTQYERIIVQFVLEESRQLFSLLR